MRRVERECHAHRTYLHTWSATSRREADGRRASLGRRRGGDRRSDQGDRASRRGRLGGLIGELEAEWIGRISFSPTPNFSLLLARCRPRRSSFRDKLARGRARPPLAPLARKPHQLPISVRSPAEAVGGTRETATIQAPPAATFPKAFFTASSPPFNQSPEPIPRGSATSEAASFLPPATHATFSPRPTCSCLPHHFTCQPAHSFALQQVPPTATPTTSDPCDIPTATSIPPRRA